MLFPAIHKFIIFFLQAHALLAPSPEIIALNTNSVFPLVRLNHVVNREFAYIISGTLHSQHEFI